MPRRFTASANRRHAKTKKRQKQVMQRRRKQFAQLRMDDVVSASQLTQLTFSFLPDAEPLADAEKRS